MIRADTRAIQRFAREMAQAQDRARREFQNATVDMRRTAKPVAIREITSEYNVEPAAINDKIKASAEGKGYSVALEVTDDKTRIPVTDFTTTRIVDKGVRIQLRRKGSAVVVPRSFRGERNPRVRGKLLRRVEKARDPIRSIGGISVKSMLERKSVTQAVINEVLNKRAEKIAQRVARLEGG